MTDEPGTNLATRQDPGEMTVSKAMNDTVAMLSMIRDLALDPNISAEKLRVVSEVANEQKDRALKDQFYAAKVSALLLMPVIDKRGRIVIADKNGNTANDRVQGTFAKWPDLQRAIMPVLARYDLILTHDIDHEGPIITVTPILQHRNTYVERGGAMQLPLDTSGGKNNTQGAGSAASYGKRHTTIAMLGIRLEDSDDDGNLLATADEPLNDQQQRIVAAAEDRVKISPEAYQQWFGKLEPKDRAWLVQTGRHETFGGTPPADNTTSTTSGGPAQSQTRAKPAQQQGKHDVSTASGWTAQFKDDCAACASIEDLDALKKRATNALGRLSESHPKLWESADAAEVEARDRLEGN